MKRWRGLIEISRFVDAETEDEAMEQLAATVTKDDAIVWEVGT